ncbi:MAG: MlaD family protein [Mariprofundaceae bacterium]
MNPQARLGAFVLIALLFLLLASGRIAKVSWFTPADRVIKIAFNDVMGLEALADVRFAGLSVGTVKFIELRDNRPIVELELDADFFLPKSTHASIGSGGLVGEKYLALYADPGDTQPLPPDATIPVDIGGDIDTFIAKMSGIAGEFQEMANQVRAAFDAEGDGVSFSTLVHNTNGVVTVLAETLRENREALASTMASLQNTTQILEAQVPDIAGDLRRLSHHLAEMIELNRNNLELAASKLPEAIQASQAFFENSQKTMASADGVVRRADDMLVENRENLYRLMFEMRKAAENLEALSDDLRRNPWKLLSEKPEVPQSPRAKQEKLEEMLLTTGKMGVTPANR